MMKFNIIEENIAEELNKIYPAFKKDYMDLSISATEVKAKHDLSKKKYDILREEVKSREGFARRANNRKRRSNKR